MKNENRRIWSADDKRFARMADKKLQILQAAQRVFLRNGYERASMDAIALEAGVGKMTVYRQYTDKHTLFIACMNDQQRSRAFCARIHPMPRSSRAPRNNAPLGGASCQTR